jgi:hypothetical protein
MHVLSVTESRANNSRREASEMSQCCEEEVKLISLEAVLDSRNSISLSERSVQRIEIGNVRMRLLYELRPKKKALVT